MDLALTDDQTQILGALEGLAKPYAASPSDVRSFALASDDLDAALAEAGFLDVAFDPDLGPVTAALIAEEVARLPYAVEASASALVRPLIGELPRPLCLVEAGALTRPIRFLKEGATVLLLGPDGVSSFTATAADIRPVHESLYAFPMAMLDPTGGYESRLTRHDVDAATVKARWQVSVAIEVAGLLRAAIDATVTYVSERKQFGRPLAFFQALRHRLADGQVRATGTRWLALNAAFSGDPGDAALASSYAQESATQVVYDLHQFLGAMGMTLEHPLHLWTYRLKALQSDLGGFSVQQADAADLVWA